MVHTLFERFDMAKEHRAGRATAHLVPNPVDLQPFLRAFFAPAKLITHPSVEYLRAATGQRIQPRFTQKRQRLRDGSLENPRCQVPDFDRCKTFQVQLGSKRLHGAQQFEIPLPF